MRSLSVPWSLRPRNRAAAATAAVVAASIAAATEICGDVFFLFVIGTQEVPLDNATEDQTRLASFWRFSGDFSAAADPKLTCLRRGSLLSCFRCAFAQAFAAINPFGILPKLP